MKYRSLAVPALSVWLLAIFLASEGAWAGVFVTAKILHVHGSVRIKAPGSAEWKPAKEGDPAEPGSTLQTAPDASCDITLGEDRKSTVHMKSDSLVLLNSLDPEKIRVDLQQGRIFSLVHGLKKDSKFVVASPTAIASVRGTGWEQSLDSIKVFENSVDVVGATGEEMLVGEGQGVDIAADGNLGEMFDLPAEAKEEFKSVEAAAEQPAGQDSPGEPAGEGSDSDAFSDGFAGGGSEDIELPGTEAEDVMEEAEEQTTEAEDQEGLDDDDSPCVPAPQNNYCN